MMTRLSLRKETHLPFQINAWSAADGRVYLSLARNTLFGVEDNTFRCFSAADWTEVWACKAEFDPSGLVVLPSGVFGLTWGIARRSGFLQRMAPETGAVIWQRKLKAPSPDPAPTILADQVCVVSDGNLASFRLQDGKLVWKHPVDQCFYSPVAWPEQAAVFVGHGDGPVTCLDWRDGTVIWTRPFHGRHTVVCRSGERLVAACSSGGPLHVLDPANGRILDKLDMEVWSNVVEDDGRLFFQTFHNNEDGYRIGCVDARRMTILWDVDVPFSRGNATFSPQPLGIFGGQLLVRTYSGPLYSLDVESGAMSWQVRHEDLRPQDPEVNGLGMPMMIDGKLWLQARDYLYEVTTR